MNFDMIAPYIAPMILALVQIGFLVRDMRRVKHENRNLDGKTDNEMAQATDRIVDSAGKLASAQTITVETLSKRLDAMQAEIQCQDGKIDNLERLVKRYAERIAYLMGGIDKLLTQLANARIPPAWRPDPWDANSE